MHECFTFSTVKGNRLIHRGQIFINSFFFAFLKFILFHIKLRRFLFVQQGIFKYFSDDEVWNSFLKWFLQSDLPNRWQTPFLHYLQYQLNLTHYFFLGFDRLLFQECLWKQYFFFFYTRAKTYDWFLSRWINFSLSYLLIQSFWFFPGRFSTIFMRFNTSSSRLFMFLRIFFSTLANAIWIIVGLKFCTFCIILKKQVTLKTLVILLPFTRCENCLFQIDYNFM